MNQVVSQIDATKGSATAQPVEIPSLQPVQPNRLIGFESMLIEALRALVRATQIPNLGTLRSARAAAVAAIAKATGGTHSAV